MPDLSAVLREAFPLGSLGPTVRRWWPLGFTAVIAALTCWAATEVWFGVKLGQVGMGVGYTGTGDGVNTGKAAAALGANPQPGGAIPWGLVTAALALAAVALVIWATVRPAFARGRAIASALLAVAAVLSTLVWFAPTLMVTADLDAMTGASANATTVTFVPQTGLIATMAVTWIGASVLFMGRHNRSLADIRAGLR